MLQLLSSRGFSAPGICTFMFFSGKVCCVCLFKRGDLMFLCDPLTPTAGAWKANKHFKMQRKRKKKYIYHRDQPLCSSLRSNSFLQDFFFLLRSLGSWQTWGLGEISSSLGILGGMLELEPAAPRAAMWGPRGSRKVDNVSGTASTRCPWAQVTPEQDSLGKAEAGGAELQNPGYPTRGSKLPDLLLGGTWCPKSSPTKVDNVSGIARTRCPWAQVTPKQNKRDSEAQLCLPQLSPGYPPRGSQLSSLVGPDAPRVLEPKQLHLALCNVVPHSSCYDIP